MAIKVLVVDDSTFFRHRLADIISQYSEFELLDTASNGREAIEKTLELKPDVITMDYEMPVMDGISALREIMSQCPTPTLMISSMTYEGARVTLDALEAGAVDFVLKNYHDVSAGHDHICQLIREKLIAVAETRNVTTPVDNGDVTDSELSESDESAVDHVTGLLSRKGVEAICIGTSTGGPIALHYILKALPKHFPIPILIAQHMPEAFTGAFAERLNDGSEVSVKEAQSGDVIESGVVYLAPGGHHMMIEKREGQARVKIIDGGDQRLNYIPSVDVLFGSVAQVYGRHSLGIILTGMGKDGFEGARLLKQSGSMVWAQDEQSSLISGMPGCVSKDGLADRILSLDMIKKVLSCEA